MEAEPGFPRKRTIRQALLALAAAALVLGLSPLRLPAHNLREAASVDVGVDERLNATLPADLTFTTPDGREVRLGDYLGGGPVILTLNYYECPQLCPLIFRNLTATLNRLAGLSLDRDFRIVTVSLNPAGTAATARAKAAESYAMLRGVTEPASRWPFLLGKEGEIGRLAQAAGIRYTRLAKDNFAHPSVLVVLTPDGRIARYLYGLEQEPRDLKLALIEAAAGRIGGSTLVNRVLIACYHYDPAGRRYVLAAGAIMKGAGAVTLVAVGVPLAILWRRERRGRERTP